MLLIKDILLYLLMKNLPGIDFLLRLPLLYFSIIRFQEMKDNEGLKATMHAPPAEMVISISTPWRLVCHTDFVMICNTGTFRSERVYVAINLPDDSCSSLDERHFMNVYMCIGAGSRCMSVVTRGQQQHMSVVTTVFASCTKLGL